MTDARSITKVLPNGRWHGSYGMACCPAHDDRTPSLKITDGDYAPLLKCFAGCDSSDVAAALRDMGLLGHPSDRTLVRRQPRPKSSAAVNAPEDRRAYQSPRHHRVLDPPAHPPRAGPGRLLDR